MATAAPWQRLTKRLNFRNLNGWRKLKWIRLSCVSQDERLGTLGLPEAQNCTKASGIVDVSRDRAGPVS
ncbi:hypothetical protein AV530_003449 [Patagioenas fasciata monilis]|uniref:Uncharacterized protein n=1 Tax=Patagioenas fasciata monilis TaxID=372326 RepID=A0A1V4K2H3_PATFA|nr:hypothetical protein AV530_003449 [Patagioenas fasciata monilis]